MSDAGTQGLCLWIAYTPLHVLLSCAVARASGRRRRSELFVVADFDRAEQMARTVGSWPDSPFSAVVLVPGLHGLSSRGRRVARVVGSARTVRRRLRGRRVERITVGHDGRPESQLAMHLVARQEPPGEVRMLDDGTGMYASAGQPFDASPVARWLRRLLYGPGWTDLDTLGTHPLIERVFLMFPEVARDRLAGMVEPIPQDSVRNPAMQSLAERAVSSHDAELAAVGRIESLVLLPHSSVAGDRNEELPSFIRELCHHLSSRGGELWIKHHPREATRDPFRLGAIRGARLVPATLAVELLYLLPGLRIERVVGLPTTSLLTARWLQPDAAVRAVAPEGMQLDEGVVRAISYLGIELLRGSAPAGDRARD